MFQKSAIPWYAVMSDMPEATCCFVNGGSKGTIIIMDRFYTAPFFALEQTMVCFSVCV